MVRDILWETGHTILWDSDHLSSGKFPLGIGNLGDEVEPFRSFVRYRHIRVGNGLNKKTNEKHFFSNDIVFLFFILGMLLTVIYWPVKFKFFLLS